MHTSRHRTITTALLAATGLLGCQTPPGALDAAANAAGAPVRINAVSGSHEIEINPNADTVILRGYTDPGTVTAKVELLRPDATTFPLDFSQLVVIGTATGRLGAGGELGINTPGGTCWETFSPDILPGDHVRVTLDTQQTDETRAAFVTVDPPTLEGNKVTVRGNATDGFNRALPLAQIEVQLVSPTGQFLSSGRPEVRANGEPGALGTIAFNPAPLAPGDFTVTFTKLQTADYPRALSATARVLWLGANPDGQNERTVFDTLDGSTPTEQSPRYTGPLRVAEATTAKFFAKRANGTTTPIRSETYRFDAPYYVTSNPLAGTYANAQYVNLTTTRPATIYYTLDGSTPSEQSSRYTGKPILIARTTLKFLGIDKANLRTPVTEELFTIQDTQAPTVGARPYQAPPRVTVLGPNRLLQLYANEDAAIYYTTDGTMPTKASTRYNGKGIALTAAMLRTGRNRLNGVPVSFMAVDLAGNASPVVTGFYQP
jgi:hypothetical protein